MSQYNHYGYGLCQEAEQSPDVEQGIPIPSSPEATGGAGHTFEQNVAAYFLGLLLTRAFHSCFPTGEVHDVCFQTRNAGWHTDDILVKIQEAEGTARNFAVQVKLGFTISTAKSNSEFRDVISGAWRDFQNPALFLYERDLLSIVVSRGTQALLRDFRNLLNCASGSGSSEVFLERLEKEGYLSKLSKNQYSHIRRVICDVNSNEPSDNDLWKFFRSLRLLSYDFDDLSGQTKSEILNLLAFAAGEQEPRETARNSWNELLKLSGEGMSKAATFSYNDLPDSLRKKHHAIGNEEQASVRLLKDHSSVVLDRISTLVADKVHIDRSHLVSELLQKLETSKVVVVTGPAGNGKSAVAYEACDILAGQGHVFAFRAEEFATPHLDDTLHRAQVSLQATTLFRILSANDRNLILVESVERLLERPERDAFSDLLVLIQREDSWRLVLTCRDYSLHVFCSAFLIHAGVQHESLRIPSLTDKELTDVAKSLPSLTSLLSNRRMRALLRNPYMLDMASKMTWRGEEDLPADERAFQERVWRDIIRKESQAAESLPTLRETTFQALALRRARALTEFVTCADLDGKALAALRADNLIEFSQQTDSLAAPAHDVLEDWAIQHWISVQWAIHHEAHQAFLAELDNHPAIRRAYRQWLKALMETDLARASEYVLAVFRDHAVPSHMRDDTLVSMMLSENARQFLRNLSSEFLGGEPPLLIELIRLLRTACKVPFIGIREAGIVPTGPYLVPKGEAWAVILEVVADSLDCVLERYRNLTLELVADWSISVNLETPYPGGARSAGIILLQLQESYEGTGYRHDEQVKRIIDIMLDIPKVCEEKLMSLIHAVCQDAPVSPEKTALVEMILEGFANASICRDYPDEVIRLAGARWKSRPPQDEEVYDYYRDCDLAHVFGLSHHCEHGHFPASAWHGPFLQLLRHHPEKGRKFVVDLINHATESYAADNSGKIEKPYRIKLVLKDGSKIEQWCNERLWLLYRGLCVSPHVLECAVMALEAWLLEQTERGEPVAPILDAILSESKSAALSAIVASVAAAHPDLAGDCAIPLLKCRDFIQLDLIRRVKEQMGAATELENIHSFSTRHTVWNLERKKSNSLTHRTSDLEGLALRLQAGQLRGEIQAIIDHHHSVLPSPEEQSEADKTWRLSLHRMDLRKYRSTGQLEDGRIIIQAGEPESDLQEFTRTSNDEHAPVDLASRLHGWGYSILHGQGDVRKQSEEWQRYLDEAVEASTLLEGLVDDNSIRLLLGGVSYVATICIRDHWDELLGEQQSWCVDTVVDAVTRSSDVDDYLYVIGRNPYEADRPAAFILSALLTKNLTPQDRDRVEKALIQALTHTCGEVSEYTAHGVGTFLWPKVPELARRCVSLLISRASIKSELRATNRAKPWNERESYECICREANFRARDAADSIVPVLDDCMGSLDFNSHELQSEVPLLVQILGTPSARSTGKVFMGALCKFLVETWRQRNNNRGSDRAELSHQIEVTCLERFARYCLELESDEVLEVCMPLIDSCADLPDHVGDFLSNLIAAEDRNQQADVFWRLWQELAEAVRLAPWLDHLRDAYVGETKLIDQLFLGNYWKTDVRDWAPLNGNHDKIERLFEDIPLSAVSLSAFLRYLYQVGREALPQAFVVISKKISDEESESILSNENIRFYLESLVGTFVYGRPRQIKTDANLRRSVLQLLDLMVASGSSSAYIMRDDFVTPLPLSEN